MVTPHDDAATDLQAMIAQLRADLDAALADKQELAERLARRDVAYEERMAHQQATSVVLKAMAASPGDPQPVFKQIVERACEFCRASGAAIAIVDHDTLHLACHAGPTQAVAQAYEALFPRPIRPDTMFGRIILTRRALQLSAMEDDREYALSSLARQVSIQTMAGVPLLRDGTAIGAIGLAATTSQPFTDVQVELLKTFAEQAVIAITSAETYRSLNNALEQQTATSEVLRVINASRGELAPVFDALLDNALRQCSGTMGGIFLFQQGHAVTASLRGVTPAFAEYNARQSLDEIRPGGVPARIIETKAPVQHADIAMSPAFNAGYPYARALVELGGVRSVLAVPLLKENAAIGMISVYRQPAEAFADKQVSLLENFASQAVIAMENARLLTEQREALERQTATAELLQVINANPGNLTPVFDALLDNALRLCNAPFGGLYVRDGMQARGVAVRGMPPAYAAFRREHSISLERKEHPLARCMDTGQPVEIADVATDESIYPEDRPVLVDLAGVRSILDVPLVKDGRGVGAIAIYQRTPGQFAKTQIALLENFAAQAVIAMENARLLTEQRVALEQQTATAEVLQVINASPGDLTPVFEAMLEKATELCQAEFGALQLFEGDSYRTVATRHLPDALVALTRGLVRIQPGTSLARIRSGERLVHIADIANDETYAANRGLRRAGVDIGGARTCLWLALQKDEETLGCFTIFRQEVRLFSKRQIALLENFAAQAVIAMENARLLTEQREALEQQTATAEVLRTINTHPGDLRPVFDAMLEKAMRLCEASFGSLYTYDGEAFHSAAQKGVPAAYAAYRQVHPPTLHPGGHTARIFASRRPVQTLDVKAEDIYKSGFAGARAVVDLGGARTFVSVPLLKENLFVGHMDFYRQEARAFTDKHIALLESFAAQAVIAMENARLLGDLRKRTADLQEALDYQTAVGDVLSVISTFSYDLAPVFQVVVETAARLCRAEQASIYRLHDGAFRWAASVGLPPDYEAIERRVVIEPGTGTLVGRVALERKPVQILDALADPQYDVKEDARIGLVRTMLGVPLLRDGVVVGVIGLGKRRAEPYTQQQADLVQTFADQAVIAMENGRLLTEQREALEQQAATAEILKVINASLGHLAPVFDAVLDKAMRLCDAAFGSLYTYDGKKFHSASQHGVPPAYAEFRAANPPASTAQTMITILDTKQPVQILDLTEGQPYRSGDRGARAMVELGGIRTILTVPLLKDRTVLGIVSVFRQEVRAFTEKQTALLESFAAQAVIAMENARLLTEQREALERQTATAEVLQVINASPGNLKPVFDAMLDKAMRLCDAAFGSLYTFDGTKFQSAAQCGVPAAYANYRATNPPPVTSRALSALLESKQPVETLDLKSVPNYGAGEPNVRAMVDLGGIRTILAVPLLKDGTVVGIVSVYRQEVRAFTEKQIALLQSFAAQAVIAMENARLLNEVRLRQEELRITFENMGDGVAMFDASHRLIAWNGRFQEILDLPDALLEQQCSYDNYLRFLAARGDFGAGVDTAEQIERLVASTGHPYGYERTRPDGRVIEIRRNPVPDGGFVLMFSDITERKRSEEELRAARDAAEAAYRELKAAQANLIQAEKMASLGQLTAGIAHEIKNPLNFVNNFAALSVDLLDELKETAAPAFATLDDNARADVEDLTGTLDGNLRKIEEHGRRADGIVKSMLEHSRGASSERRIVDINRLVEEALNLAYHGARAQDQSFAVELERDFGAGIGPIELNPQDMTRVCLNLFSNGFYAARKRQRAEGVSFRPKLEVATRAKENAVEIRVRDNGIGISDDVRDKLFQPFFTTKPTGEGTGLGLSITYDIVTKQHGGTIAVDSEVGAFTEFTVMVPRQKG